MVRFFVGRSRFRMFAVSGLVCMPFGSRRCMTGSFMTFAVSGSAMLLGSFVAVAFTFTFCLYKINGSDDKAYEYQYSP